MDILDIIFIIILIAVIIACIVLFKTSGKPRKETALELLSIMLTAIVVSLMLIMVLFFFIHWKSYNRVKREEQEVTKRMLELIEQESQYEDPLEYEKEYKLVQGMYAETVTEAKASKEYLEYIMMFSIRFYFICFIILFIQWFIGRRRIKKEYKGATNE